MRLWSLIDGSWRFRDLPVTAANGPQPARIISHTPNLRLGGASVLFLWSSGVGANAYWFSIGLTQGGYDIYEGYMGTTLGFRYNNVPTDGRQLWVRIWSYVDGTWLFSDMPLLAAQ